MLQQHRLRARRSAAKQRWRQKRRRLREVELDRVRELEADLDDIDGNNTDLEAGRAAETNDDRNVDGAGHTYVSLPDPDPDHDHETDTGSTIRNNICNQSPAQSGADADRDNSDDRKAANVPTVEEDGSLSAKDHADIGASILHSLALEYSLPQSAIEKFIKLMRVTAEQATSVEGFTPTSIRRYLALAAERELEKIVYCICTCGHPFVKGSACNKCDGGAAAGNLEDSNLTDDSDREGEVSSDYSDVSTNGESSDTDEGDELDHDRLMAVRRSEQQAADIDTAVTSSEPAEFAYVTVKQFLEILYADKYFLSAIKRQRVLAVAREDGQYRDVTDGARWKEWEREGFFDSPFNLALSLSIDGFNPASYAKGKKKYQHGFVPFYLKVASLSLSLSLFFSLSCCKFRLYGIQFWNSSIPVSEIPVPKLGDRSTHIYLLPSCRC